MGDHAQKNVWDNQDLENVLLKGGIAVMPTDTIYGVVGSAKIPEVIERLYKVRQRPLDKPFIILIGDKNEIKKFDISFSQIQKDFLEREWGDVYQKEERPITFVIDCVPNSPDSIAYINGLSKGATNGILQNLIDLSLIEHSTKNRFRIKRC